MVLAARGLRLARDVRLTLDNGYAAQVLTVRDERRGAAAPVEQGHRAARESDQRVRRHELELEALGDGRDAVDVGVMLAAALLVLVPAGGRWRLHGYDLGARGRGHREVG